MKPKIAIIGQGAEPLKNDVMKKAEVIGALLAKNYCEVFTGAGLGYPLAAAKGAMESGADVTGISPAINEDEHKEEYGFSVDCFSRIEYTGKGIPERNYDLIQKVDAVIMIGGKIGTLNEFTLAYHKGKVIGILEGSTGIVNLMHEIATVCDKNGEKENIIYSESPEELVSKVLERLLKK